MRLTTPALALAACRNAWARLCRQFADERPSLQGRLLATLVLLLLLLGGLEGADHFSHQRAHQALLQEEWERAAATAAAGTRSNLTQLYRTLDAVALATQPGRMDALRAPLYLEQVRNNHPGMLALLVANSFGEVTAANPPAGTGASVQGYPFFGQLNAATRHHLSDTYAPGPELPPRVLIASLVFDGRRPAGVVAAELGVNGLRPLLPATGDQHRYLLLDPEGRVAVATGGDLPPPTHRAVLRQAAMEVRGSGRPVIRPELAAAIAPVPATGWAVAALPEAGAAGPTPPSINLSLFLISMTVVVLALAVLLVVRISLQPVVALSAASRLLGSGDLSLRLPPAEVREFEGLVEAFNRMAGQLEAARNQLVEANQDLEARVRSRTSDLEAQHEKLLRAERLSTLGLLSSAIAHDLRNPLNTVSLGIQTLEMRLANDPDVRLKERLAGLQREVRRAEGIIRTLLGFARTGAPERAPVDLAELAGEVVAVIGPAAGITVKVALPADLPSVELDRAQFFQVLENLVRNALQVMPEGGQVTLSAALDAGALVLRVADTGPGIPPEMRDTLFEPLVTTRTTGTGLGLALCKRIVEAHGGRISVEAVRGPGAVIRIELPLA
jgi:signal transduction histidine kinase